MKISDLIRSLQDTLRERGDVSLSLRVTTPEFPEVVIDARDFAFNEWERPAELLLEVSVGTCCLENAVNLVNEI